MRVTDNRYAAEMAKFELAVRMIGHEARTGTIRSCTGFSEDRIRKIYATYFKNEAGNEVRRRRGKTPRQVATFVTSSRSQSEATVMACLFRHYGLIDVRSRGGLVAAAEVNPLQFGNRLCKAFETYRGLYDSPSLCFEQTWSLYNALALEQEMYFADCDDCGAVYVQDRYSLDERRCPFCEQKREAI